MWRNTPQSVHIHNPFTHLLFCWNVVTIWQMRKCYQEYILSWKWGKGRMALTVHSTSTWFQPETGCLTTVYSANQCSKEMTKVIFDPESVKVLQQAQFELRSINITEIIKFLWKLMKCMAKEFLPSHKPS